MGWYKILAAGLTACLIAFPSCAPARGQNSTITRGSEGTKNIQSLEEMRRAGVVKQRSGYELWRCGAKYHTNL